MTLAQGVLERYSALQVPRYTSYPTAAEFSASVGKSDGERWLSRLDGRKPISVYFHVPYCRQLCHYCGCHAKAYTRDTVLQTYTEALAVEIESVAAVIGKQLAVGRIHWGGGTPSSIGTDALMSVYKTLGRYFAILGEAEHAIELDPRLVTVELAQNLAMLGITRVSIGVQDTDPLVQAAIGRIQPLEQVRQAFFHLRAAGISSISVDLIYGLPLQTATSLRKTCKDIVSLRPDRIACYGYAHMPNRRANQRQIDEAQLPDNAKRLEQVELVSSELAQHGYHQIGIDHFALEGDRLSELAASKQLHRNFQGYTDDDSSVLIGFGASAISHLPDGFLQNETDPQRYARTVLDFNLATTRGRRLSHEDRIRAGIIERLMCDFSADLNSLANGVDFSDEIALLRPMVQDNIVTISGGVVTMTEAGKPLVRLVAATFDAYRRSTTGHFSSAV